MSPSTRLDPDVRTACIGRGVYHVVDTADAIKADLGSGSSVLDADVVEVMSVDTLELTVSEYNQLTSGQTLVTPYHIVDQRYRDRGRDSHRR